MEELSKSMSSLGEKMTGKEIDLMIKEADTDTDGFINYEGIIVQSYVCTD